MIPTWPQKARSTIAYLYRPLQDVDIYVEDAKDEALYTELFRRIAPKNVRIAKVVALGDRLRVIEKAKQYDFPSRRALFLVDGDLEWVRGDSSPDHVFRLDAYCIENILLHEDAAVQVVMEESAIGKEQAEKMLNFTRWRNEISQALVELFVSFAALNSVAPDEPTVGLGVGYLLTASKKGIAQQLDAGKVQAVLTTIQNKTVATVGVAKSTQLRENIKTRVTALPQKSDVISGKDFLMPLFHFHLTACTKTKPHRTSLRMRLALHCSLDRLKSLSKALANS